jgi:hypothetical protein
MQGSNWAKKKSPKPTRVKISIFNTETAIRLKTFLSFFKFSQQPNRAKKIKENENIFFQHFKYWIQPNYNSTITDKTYSNWISNKLNYASLTLTLH